MGIIGFKYQFEKCIHKKIDEEYCEQCKFLDKIRKALVILQEQRRWRLIDKERIFISEEKMTKKEKLENPVYKFSGGYYKIPKYLKI